MEQVLCPFCQNLISPTFFYCPVCGKKIKEPPLSTTILKQIFIYLVSFFLPPFGLGWGFQYLKQESSKARTIGWIAIVLTVVSIILTIWITFGVIHYYTSILNSISNGSIPDTSSQGKVLQDLQRLQQ